MNALTFTFENPDSAADAVEKLHELGAGGIEIMSPVPHHRLEEAARTGPSRTGPVHWFSLIGAVVGCTLGWTLTILTALDYPVQTSGRPVVTPHVFLIVAYEMTLLVAIVMTLVGFLAISQLPTMAKGPYHSASNWDKVVVVVDGLTPDAREVIERCGGVPL